MHLAHLTIAKFRNISHISLGVPDDARVVGLIGPNGAGKTSVLEAISLLSGSRGLENAEASEQGQNGIKTWGVHAQLIRADDEPCTLAVGVSGGKKQVKIDGVSAEPHALATACTALGGIVWSGPRLDRLFYGPPASRREQLDDWTTMINPAHTEALSRYKTHTTNRLRLLRDGKLSGDWLDAEEFAAAEWGIKLLRGRMDYLNTLTPHLTDISLALSGGALTVLDDPDPTQALLGKFQRSREIDARSERTHAGPNTLDVSGTLNLVPQQVPLHLASSGQHKRAVTGWLLGHVHALAAHPTLHRSGPPLVLLDELGAHLDAPRREALLGALLGLGCRVWFSDVSVDNPPAGTHVIQLDNGQVIG